MSRKISEWFFGGEKAQAMTEYILVVTALMITGATAFTQFGKILLGYYNLIAIMVALPIP